MAKSRTIAAGVLILRAWVLLWVVAVVGPTFSSRAYAEDDNGCVEALTFTLADALKLAETDPLRVCQKVASMNIPEETDRIRLALAVARHFDNQIGRWLAAFNISDEKAIFDIAKEAAQSNPGRFHAYFENFNITDPDKIIELVKLAARHFRIENSENIIANFEKFQITDRTALLEIAKSFARVDGRDVIKYIDTFKITNPSDLVDLAEIIAASQKTDLENVIKACGVTEYNDRLRVALAASGSAWAWHEANNISLYLEHFNITDEDDLFEIAKRAAARNGGSVSQHLQKYKIKDPHRLKEVALIAASNAGAVTAQFIKNYGFTDVDTLFEIARAAFSNSAHAIQHLADFGFTDQWRLIELAKLAANQDGGVASSYIEYFKFSDPDLLFEIAKIAARNDGRSTAIHFSNYGITDKSAILEIARLCIQEITVSSSLSLRLYYYSNLKKFDGFQFEKSFLLQLILSLDPEVSSGLFIEKSKLKSIDVEINALTGLSEGDLNRERLKREVTAVLERDIFQSQSLKSFAGTPLLWNHIEKREVVLGLLAGLAKLGLEPEPNAELNSLKQDPDSLRLLAAMIGLPYSHLKGLPAALSSNRLGTFFELAIELSNQVSSLSNEPIFQGVTFDPQLFKRQNLPKILEWLEKTRDLLNLTPPEERHFLYENLKKEWIQSGLTKENIEGATAVLKTKIVTLIRKMFEQTEVASAVAGTEHLTFTYDDLERLKATWGDIAPIFTLLSRFQGKVSWRKEIPVLKRVFAAVLAGKFHELKFEGFTPEEKEFVQKQIGFLSPQAQSAWKSIHQRINLWKPSAESGQVKQQSHLSEVKAALNTNFKIHWEQSFASLESAPPRLTEKINEIIYQAQGPPKDTLKSIEQLPELQMQSETKVKLILQSVVAAFNEFYRLNEFNDTNASRLQSMATFLSFYLRESADHSLTQSSEESLGQIQADLTTMIDNLRQAKLAVLEQQKGAAIIFTTTFHDPKLLLSIGDLVNASSCQNFKTGSHIETLLGYVIDANVIGLASFAFTIADFQKPKDFEVLMRAFESGVDLGNHLRFDPNNKSLNFEFEFEGQKYKIASKAKDYAHRRHVLKLGKTAAGQAGIRPERAYLQGHGAGDLMALQTSEVIQEMQQQMGISAAASTEPLEITASQNPGGVYSDGARGAQTRAYIFPVNANGL